MLMFTTASGNSSVGTHMLAITMAARTLTTFQAIALLCCFRLAPTLHFQTIDGAVLIIAISWRRGATDGVQAIAVPRPERNDTAANSERFCIQIGTRPR